MRGQNAKAGGRLTTVQGKGDEAMMGVGEERAG
jgi:hypothetical protein